ncbi:MAG: DHA2 family efflux MFS transporter permease subunit, partial [Pseudorhodobacter sp.]|nr:DHA2 family efflux MFS transporter permease subunit [Frankiaceae bacterium]
MTTLADAVETADVPEARRSNRNGSLVLASFGALLAFLDVTIVNVAFPSIQGTFRGSSYAHLSWVLNSYNIVFAALLVAAGRLADVYGRRRTFATGVLVFTVASAACAAAPTVGLLVAARALQGVGAGLLVPASLALVVEAFPPERRSHAIGIWGASAAFAAGIGPPLGGALVRLQDWRLAFLVNVPLGIGALVAANRVLVGGRGPGRGRLPDLRGATLLGVSTAAVTLAVIQGPSWGWTDPRVLAAFVVTVLGAVGFSWSSRRHPVPVLDPELLRIPTFVVGNVVTFLAGMGFYAYMLNNILWLHYVWGYSLLRSGLAVAPGAVVAALIAAVLGRVADRRGHRLVAVPGALVWAAAYLWYVNRVGVTPDFLGAWLPGQVLSGIGVGATLPIVASAALEAVPGGRYATASAVVSSSRQLGAVLGVALLVDIVGSPAPGQAVTAFRQAWVLSVVCFVAVSALCLFLRRSGTTLVEQVALPGSPELSVRPARAAAGIGLHSPLLANLTGPARSRLLAQGALVTVEAGRWLFQDGDATDGMYVVRSGRLDVVGPEGVVRELGAGDVVGELGALTGQPRSAGVRARRDAQLWWLSSAKVDALLERDSA